MYRYLFLQHSIKFTYSFTTMRLNISNKATEKCKKKCTKLNCFKESFFTLIGRKCFLMGCISVDDELFWCYRDIHCCRTEKDFFCYILETELEIWLNQISMSVLFYTLQQKPCQIISFFVATSMERKCFGRFFSNEGHVIGNKVIDWTGCQVVPQQSSKVNSVQLHSCQSADNASALCGWNNSHLSNGAWTLFCICFALNNLWIQNFPHLLLIRLEHCCCIL